MLKTTPFKEYCCKNCELSVHIGGHYICTKYGMSVNPEEDVCANIERRFTYADQNKTIVHNSEVDVKKF